MKSLTVMLLAMLSMAARGAIYSRVTLVEARQEAGTAATLHLESHPDFASFLDMGRKNPYKQRAPAHMAGRQAWEKRMLELVEKSLKQDPLVAGRAAEIVERAAKADLKVFEAIKEAARSNLPRMLTIEPSADAVARYTAEARPFLEEEERARLKALRETLPRAQELLEPTTAWDEECFDRAENVADRLDELADAKGGHVQAKNLRERGLLNRSSLGVKAGVDRARRALSPSRQGGLRIDLGAASAGPDGLGEIAERAVRASAPADLTDERRLNARADSLTFFLEDVRRRSPEGETPRVRVRPDGTISLTERRADGVYELRGRFEAPKTPWSSGVRARRLPVPADPLAFFLEDVQPYAPELEGSKTPWSPEGRAVEEGLTVYSRRLSDDGSPQGPWGRGSQYVGRLGMERYGSETSHRGVWTDWVLGTNVEETPNVLRQTRRDGKLVRGPGEEELVRLPAQTVEEGAGLWGQFWGPVGRGGADLLAAGYSGAGAGTITALRKLGVRVDPLEEQAWHARMKTNFLGNSLSSELRKNMVWGEEGERRYRAESLDDSVYVQNVGKEVGGVKGAVLQGLLANSNDLPQNIIMMKSMMGGFERLGAAGTTGKIAAAAIGGSMLANDLKAKGEAAVELHDAIKSKDGDPGRLEAAAQNAAYMGANFVQDIIFSKPIQWLFSGKAPGNTAARLDKSIAAADAAPAKPLNPRSGAVAQEPLRRMAGEGSRKPAPTGSLTQRMRDIPPKAPEHPKITFMREMLRGRIEAMTEALSGAEGKLDAARMEDLRLLKSMSSKLGLPESTVLEGLRGVLKAPIEADADGLLGGRGVAAYDPKTGKILFDPAALDSARSVDLLTVLMHEGIHRKNPGFARGENDAHGVQLAAYDSIQGELKTRGRNTDLTPADRRPPPEPDAVHRLLDEMAADFSEGKRLDNLRRRYTKEELARSPDDRLLAAEGDHASWVRVRNAIRARRERLSADPAASGRDWLEKALPDPVERQRYLDLEKSNSTIAKRWGIDERTTLEAMAKAADENIAARNEDAQQARLDLDRLRAQNIRDMQPNGFRAGRYFPEWELFLEDHPAQKPRYHDWRHSIRVAKMAYDYAVGRGLPEETARLVGEVALLHDFDPDPTRLQKGTPASVPRTLARLTEDFSGARSLEGEPGVSVLKKRFNWSDREFLLAKAMIQRTEYPFGNGHFGKPWYRDAKTSPLKEYMRTLKEIRSTLGDRDLEFALREGPLLSEYADIPSHYSMERFDGAMTVVEGLASEIRAAKGLEGPPTTKDFVELNTGGFLSDLGGKQLEIDPILAKKVFQVEGFSLPNRREAFARMPERYGRVFESNRRGFEEFQRALAEGLELDAAKARGREAARQALSGGNLGGS